MRLSYSRIIWLEGLKWYVIKTKNYKGLKK